jgi:hypothetical protein
MLKSKRPDGKMAFLMGLIDWAEQNQDDPESGHSLSGGPDDDSERTNP